MIATPNILVVDDEKVIRDSLHDWFAEDGYDIDVAENAQEALKHIDHTIYDIVLLDIKMPGMDGLTLQEKIIKQIPQAIIIIMTAYASVETAVQALKMGAYDYLQKPIDPDELQHIIEKAVERQHLVHENRQLKKRLETLSQEDMPELVGQSPQMQRVKSLIHTVAPTDTTVLILGESGTGKELVARAIHRHSPRHHMPLVTAHCAGLPEGLIESELFGHEKGAFTGAAYRRKGKFELADKGSIFFDEIADISPKTQIDLLRILQERNFTRLGGTHPIETDFRVIAATNRNLALAVSEGHFRQDLYYRLDVFTIEIPPLRERPQDIVLLAQHFLIKYAQKMNKSIQGFSPDATKALTQYYWPGNVRELENTIERAVVIQKGSEIHIDNLKEAQSKTSTDTTNLSLAAQEKQHIASVLQLMQGNISQTAKTLDIDRVTLYNKIKKYDLKRSH
jgi:DNA-binding NtrC family response regulator